MEVVRLLFRFGLFIPYITLRAVNLLLLRPLFYGIRVFLAPQRIALSTLRAIAHVPVDLLQGFDSILPYILLLSLTGALTGLILHLAYRLLSHLLALNPPQLSTTSTTTSTTVPLLLPSLTARNRTPTPPSSNSHSPTTILHPKTPQQDPSFQLPASPTPATYKDQMRQLMADRQIQLVTLHEEEKRRRRIQEWRMQRQQQAGRPGAGGVAAWLEGEVGAGAGRELGAGAGTGLGLGIMGSPGGVVVGLQGQTILEEEEDGSDF